MARILKMRGPRIGVTYRVTRGPTSWLKGTVLDITEGIARIEVKDGTFYSHARYCVQPGSIMTVPVALTLFEEVK